MTRMTDERLAEIEHAIQAAPHNSVYCHSRELLQALKSANAKVAELESNLQAERAKVAELESKLYSCRRDYWSSLLRGKAIAEKCE